jgi:hypothetical protein
MWKGRFLSLVLKQNENFVKRDFKKYLKPIARIQNDIMQEARKGEHALEISKQLDEPILNFFKREGFLVKHEKDPIVTKISWSIKNKT